MNKYWVIIADSYIGYFNYLLNETVNPSWSNYFYGLLIISGIVWILEMIFPWRKDQPIFRKDFFLDLFYLFFNFFLLNLIILIALSNVAAEGLNDFLGIFGLHTTSIQLFDVTKMPQIVALLLFFVISDFVQWLVHISLHRVPFLWKVHQTHHSVKVMGFAAHFRYNWMEPIVYKTVLYVPIALIGGFTISDIFIVHFFAIAIGHLNHANIGWDYGPFKYILNNPKMHIWHHSKKLPNQYGANFGISLSLWDYLFKTDYIPSDGRDIEIGFDGDQEFPHDFIGQEIFPLK